MLAAEPGGGTQWPLCLVQLNTGARPRSRGLGHIGEQEAEISASGTDIGGGAGRPSGMAVMRRVWPGVSER